MSIDARRAAFRALTNAYHNSFENVSEGPIRHSRQFIRNVLMQEAGKAALGLDPRLTSTDSGAIAVGLARRVMTNERAAKSFVDIEISESGVGSYIVSFDKDIQPDMAVTLINTAGTSAMLCKVGDHLGEGLVSDLLLLAVEPSPSIAESLIADAKGRVDENYTMTNHDGFTSHDHAADFYHKRYRAIQDKRKEVADATTHGEHAKIAALGSLNRDEHNTVFMWQAHRRAVGKDPSTAHLRNTPGDATNEAALHTEVGKSLDAAGMGGSKLFASPGEGWNALHNTLHKHGLTIHPLDRPDGPIDDRGDKHHEIYQVARPSQKSGYSPEPVHGSYLSVQRTGGVGDGQGVDHNDHPMRGKHEFNVYLTGKKIKEPQMPSANESAEINENRIPHAADEWSDPITAGGETSQYRTWTHNGGHVVFKKEQAQKAGREANTDFGPRILRAPAHSTIGKTWLSRGKHELPANEAKVGFRSVLVHGTPAGHDNPNSAWHALVHATGGSTTHAMHRHPSGHFDVTFHAQEGNGKYEAGYETFARRAKSHPGVTKVEIAPHADRVGEAEVGPIDKGVWSKAEAAAVKTYGESTRENNSDKFYAITMSIYKKMKGVSESTHGTKPAEKTQESSVNEAYTDLAKAKEIAHALADQHQTPHFVHAVPVSGGTKAYAIHTHGSLNHAHTPEARGEYVYTATPKVKESVAPTKFTPVTISEAQAAILHTAVFGDKVLNENVEEAKAVPRTRVMFSHPVEHGDVMPMIKKIGDEDAEASIHDYCHARKCWIHHFSFTGKNSKERAVKFGARVTDKLGVPHHILSESVIKESASPLENIMRAFAAPGLRPQQTSKFDDVLSASVAVIKGWHRTDYGVCAESAEQFDELVENVVCALAEKAEDGEVARRATFEIAEVLVEEVSSEDVKNADIFAKHMPTVVRARLIESGIGYPAISATLSEICK